MLKEFALELEGLVQSLPDKDQARRRIQLIASGTEAGMEASRPLSVFHEISETQRAIRANLLEFDEDKVRNLTLDHDAILSGLIPLESEVSWSKRHGSIRRALEKIERSLKQILASADFSIEAIEKADFAYRMATASLKAAETRIESELVSEARVMLCTIGSSHRLPLDDHEADTPDTDDGSDVDRMGKPTVVVFDEAGCIPSYEFLGLSRLGRSIESLICVGDKHQLPPYSPGTSQQKSGRSRTAYSRSGLRSKPLPPAALCNVKSLLDVSALTVDDCKIKLTTQYRVPRDIAGLLNARVYNGDYATAEECQAPTHGLEFVDIPFGRNSDHPKKYVNYREIDECKAIVRQLLRDDVESIMILTPVRRRFLVRNIVSNPLHVNMYSHTFPLYQYKKQQREIQFTFQRDGVGNDKVQVLTIDQCQGQEADYVILSLVQKPTMFLSKNRLNVALSRVRRKLFLLADRELFREASRNSKWECSLLAKDLLEMTLVNPDQD